jgi:hypothetical protein
MVNIGIIDDRKEARETVARFFQVLHKGNVRTIDIDPLENVDSYPSWIYDNEISSLVVDERLHEQATSKATHVRYNGHNLVDHLRERMPVFPVFVLTSNSTDDALLKRAGKIDAIIDRSEFRKKPNEFTERVVRAGSKFHEQHTELLAELSAISGRMAIGAATKKDLERADAIRALLGIAFPFEELSEKGQWLKELRSTISRAEKLQTRIEQFLSTTGKKK